MSEDTAGKNTLSRRDAVKVFSTVAATGLAPQPPPFVTDTFTGAEFTMTSIAPEEVPGGVDLTLTLQEKTKFETEWSVVANQTEFVNFESMAAKVSIMLNVSRARELKSGDFYNFFADFINSDILVQENILLHKPQLLNFLHSFASVRDDALNGEIPTALYSLWATEFIQSLMACSVDENRNFYITGNNIFAFTPLVPVSMVIPGTEESDYYHIPSNSNGSLDKAFFDASKSVPSTEYIQRDLKSIDDICLGDVLFKDRRNGFITGHPTTVLAAPRDSRTGYLNSIFVFDANKDGRMVADVNKFLDPAKEKLGILRTQNADSSLYLILKTIRSALPVANIPTAIFEGRADIIPDFSKIPEISSLWEDLKNPKKVVDTIEKIILLLGLKVRDLAGDLSSTPRWIKAEVGGKYICNLFSVTLLNALNLKNKVGLWYVNGAIAQNIGDIYPTQGIHEYLNVNARKNGMIDMTFASKEERDKVLGTGKYIYYISTRGHTAVVVPGKNKDGYLIPVLSQAGYDEPLWPIDFGYKYIRPRSLSDFHDFPDQAIIWAIPLVDGQEPKDPYRTPLYDSKIPEEKDKDKSFWLGWLTTIKDLKAIVGDKDLGVFAKYIEGKKEKLSTGNHIFQFAFDVVQAIQNYKMPIGIDYSQDPAYFTNHIKKVLTEKGYGKIVNSEYANKIFSGIQARFVTKERSRIEGRPFQPLQCVDLHNLFSLAANLPGAPVQINSLPGHAEDMANMLFSGQTPDSSSGVVRFNGDRPTDLKKFKAGDSFFIAYGGESDGHVGVVVTDPFVNTEGVVMIGVADSNRHVINQNGSTEIESDGMPRLRFMDYELFMREYLTGRDNRPTGRMVVLRKRK